jgi:hypothetical protein
MRGDHPQPMKHLHNSTTAAAASARSAESDHEPTRSVTTLVVPRVIVCDSTLTMAIRDASETTPTTVVQVIHHNADAVAGKIDHPLTKHLHNSTTAAAASARSAVSDHEPRRSVTALLVSRVTRDSTCNGRGRHRLDDSANHRCAGVPPRRRHTGGRT